MAIPLDAASQHEFEKFKRAIEEYPGIEPEIDLLGRRVKFAPYSISGAVPDDDEVHVVLYEDQEPLRSIGVLRLTRSQWVKLKAEVEVHLDALAELRGK